MSDVKLFYGWRIVAACFVIACFAWALCLYGSSVYLQAVTTTHNWSILEVSSAISVFLLVSAVAQSSVGRSIKRWGPRSTLLVGVICVAVSVALLGRVTRPWQLFPCFALLGVGWAALSTTAISTTVAPWFERHQGRSIALAITGASVGAIAGVPLLLLAIKQLGLDLGLLTVAVVTALVLLPLIMVAFRYRAPDDLGLERDGGPPPGSMPNASLGASIATSGNRQRLLWSATIGFSLALTVQIGFITHHVTMAESFLGVAGAGLLVSATGIVAFIGRLYLTRVADRASARRLAAQAMASQAIAMIAIGLWPSIPVLIIGSLVYGYAIGHVTTLSPIMVRREFGAEAFAAAYGTSATVIQLTSAFGPALMGYLRDVLGGYPQAFLFAATFTALGCACIVWGRPR